jgi:hypothetical protein
MNKPPYPALDKFDIKVYTRKDGVHYVKWPEVYQALESKGLSESKFDKHFGTQTQIMEGAFAGDVEAVLILMTKGKRTGTQLYWD